mmetsp:Transcript_46788/g.138251  ORF Transcript_46788/g.138251 Transcript_46788/m.138251 type:complete len:269 (+) Transcript_46788:364-1170(+)
MRGGHGERPAALQLGQHDGAVLPRVRQHLGAHAHLHPLRPQRAGGPGVPDRRRRPRQRPGPRRGRDALPHADAPPVARPGLLAARSGVRRLRGGAAHRGRPLDAPGGGDPDRAAAGRRRGRRCRGQPRRLHAALCAARWASWTGPFLRAVPPDLPGADRQLRDERPPELPHAQQGAWQPQRTQDAARARPQRPGQPVEDVRGGRGRLRAAHPLRSGARGGCGGGEAGRRAAARAGPRQDRRGEHGARPAARGRTDAGGLPPRDLRGGL